MPRLIAVDLGSHAAKVTTWRVVSRTTLAREGRYRRAVPQSGDLPTREHRFAALDVLLEEESAVRPGTGDVVVLAFPASEAAFHRVAMPFSDRAQIERTLPFAIENEVPFELDDMALAWRQCGKTGAQTDVLVVLARREGVVEWLQALDERGLDPASVHVEADLYGPWGALPPGLTSDTGLDLEKRELVAVLDLGHTHSVLSIVRDGTVVLARSINVGGWSFTKAIQDTLACTWEEAERLKHGDVRNDVPAEDEITVSLHTGDPRARRHSGYASLPAVARERVDESIGLLLAEIRSTLIKAEDTLGNEVHELRITGGSSKIDELWGYLSADLGIPVKQAQDPRGEPTPAAYAVSQALAGATLLPDEFVTDLRVGALAYRGGTDLLRSALLYGAAGAGIFALAGLVLFLVQYRSLAVELSATEEQAIAVVTATLPQLAPGGLDTLSKAEGILAEFTQDAVQRAEVLGDGTTSVPPTIDTLYALTKAFPPHPDVSVELSDLVISKAKISFNAETDGYGSSSQVEEKLKQSPRFATATKGQEQRLANGRVRFPITIPLGDDDGEGGDDGEPKTSEQPSETPTEEG
jgi:Tfp pilus assembly PilM family ATPase